MARIRPCARPSRPRQISHQRGPSHDIHGCRASSLVAGQPSRLEIFKHTRKTGPELRPAPGRLGDAALCHSIPCILWPRSRSTCPPPRYRASNGQLAERLRAQTRFSRWSVRWTFWLQGLVQGRRARIGVLTTAGRATASCPWVQRPGRLSTPRRRHSSQSWRHLAPQVSWAQLNINVLSSHRSGSAPVRAYARIPW